MREPMKRERTQQTSKTGKGEPQKEEGHPHHTHAPWKNPGQERKEKKEGEKIQEEVAGKTKQEVQRVETERKRKEEVAPQAWGWKTGERKKGVGGGKGAARER